VWYLFTKLLLRSLSKRSCCIRVPGLSAPQDRTWSRVASEYARISPPLRPSKEDVALFHHATTGHASRVLLLGVTPALATFGTSLLAVEAIPAVIESLWIGNGPDRRAVAGDWRALPCPDRSCSAIIGDGAISAADSNPVVLIREWLRVIEPEGVLAIRCFCAPSTAEQLDAIVSDAKEGQIPDLNVLKWRLAMHLAAKDPDFRVPVTWVLSEFNRLFPDRRRLLDQTGWSLDQFAFVDQYLGSVVALRFLPERRLHECIAPLAAETSFLRPKGYPLAELSPILVMRGPKLV